MTEIWDKLPDCILNKIYSKITYPQPKHLLDDIKSYVLFMNFVNSGHMNINRILWYLILYNSFYNDNKSKDEKFRNIVLNNDESEEVRLKYNILNNSQIPDLSRFSPVSQVIGIRPGELCRIERPSKTAIKSNFYRVCTNK